MAKVKAGSSRSARRDDDQPTTTEKAIERWIAELDAAKEREKDYREQGEDVIAIYSGDKKSKTPFNILYSNTETITPVLYSATPRPLVKPRMRRQEPVALASAQAGQAMLEYLVDTNVDGYQTFNGTLKDVTLKACLPGRGVSCVKYDFEEGKTPPPEGSAPEATASTYKKGETVCTESKRWDRVLFGYAHQWHKMPWIAFEEYLDRPECVRLFGEEKVAEMELTFTKGEEDDSSADKQKKSEADSKTGEKKTICVYQIWDKDGGRKVRWLAPQYKQDFLKVQDDPLGLTGFFNIPKPLQFIDKVDDLVPVAPYLLYQQQAEELNELTRRITKVTKAIKVRGAYDKSLGDEMTKIFSEDDNGIVGVDGLLGADNKGFDKAIWMVPLDVLQQVLQTLLQSRESVKQTIYEIMGIADIMRGSSKASETLGAQQIKNQWGTLRVKPKQSEVQRYARDTLRMMLEIAATQFSERTWAEMTGLPFLTAEQAVEAQRLVEAAQAQPPQTPEMQQQAQQAQQALSKPTWAQILGALKSDMHRAYLVDIETNSTVEPDAAEDKQHITELLQALAQSMQGLGPLIEQGVLPFEAAKAILLMISRRFNYGTEIEEFIKGMQPPQPKDDGKAAAEQQRLQMESQQKDADRQAQAQADERKLAADQAAAQRESAAAEAQAQREHALKMAEIEARKVIDLGKLAAERATAKYKADLEAKTAKEVAQLQISGEVEKARISAQAQIMAAKEKPNGKGATA